MLHFHIPRTCLEALPLPLISCFLLIFGTDAQEYAVSSFYTIYILFQLIVWSRVFLELLSIDKV